MPMKIKEGNTALIRWQNKPVIKSILLDDFKDFSRWTHRGFGKIMFTEERSLTGKKALRLLSPTKGDMKIHMSKRQFGVASAQLNIGSSDWSSYNRLSFWVYPVLPGFRVISMKFQLHYDGKPIPAEGVNYQQLKKEIWNHVVWEIPHINRDKITAVEFIYLLTGNEPEAANEVCFDIDSIELQRVETDKFEGWNIASGRIAFSHTGYMTGFEKKAFTNDINIKEFLLIDNESGEVILSKAVNTINTRFGKFLEMDFSEVEKSGSYIIQAGNITTKPFKISSFVWYESILKSINFFYCQRCGIEIQGIHGVCHRDWRVVHNDQSIVINGGWHDAGDLSQGLTNTAEAVHSMVSLSENLKDKDSVLAERLLDEARWGLNWLLKTRFDDGYRVRFAITEMRTDGIIGTVDDITVEATDDMPLQYFHASGAEAIAGRLFQKDDPILANYSIKISIEDWKKAVEKLDFVGIEIAAAGAQASIELYKATGDYMFKDKAIEWAQIIMDCQQRECLELNKPIAGFFYTDTDKKYILHYNHRSHEQAPIVLLAEMCQLFPHHRDWIKWYSTIVLYSEYLKAASQLTDPYYMLPCSIYDIREIEDIEIAKNQRSKIMHNILSTYGSQIKNGHYLGDSYYLRTFPVVTSNQRGHFGVLLSQTKALSVAAKIRNDPSLMNLVQKQLKWLVGLNPFAQSMMYGEGYDYSPQFTISSGDIVGSLPVGIQTNGDKDEPFWTGSNYPTYKEVWVHPSSRWLWLMKEANGAAQITGCVKMGIGHVKFINKTNGEVEVVNTEWETGEFSTLLNSGVYEVAVDKRVIKKLSLLPGTKTRLNLKQWFNFDIEQSYINEEYIDIIITAIGDMSTVFEIKTYNLQTDTSEVKMELDCNTKKSVTIKARILSKKTPWIAVVIPNRDILEMKEICGNMGLR